MTPAFRWIDGTVEPVRWTLPEMIETIFYAAAARKP